MNGRHGSRRKKKDQESPMKSSVVPLNSRPSSHMQNPGVGCICSSKLDQDRSSTLSLKGVNRTIHPTDFHHLLLA